MPPDAARCRRTGSSLHADAIGDVQGAYRQYALVDGSEEIGDDTISERRVNIGELGEARVGHGEGFELPRRQLVPLHRLWAGISPLLT